MNLLTIQLTDEKKYITIYKEIKKLILNGTLKKEEKLPSKRDLAKNLGVSINTIMTSYNLLLNEGYIYAKEKSGYYVNSFFYLKYDNKKEKKIILSEKKKYLFDFTSQEVEESTFPSYTFKKITSDIIMNNPRIFLTKSDNQGDINLRNTLSKYLLENKGIEVSEQQIIIVSSLEESLNIVHSLINIKNLAIENPGYLKIQKYLPKKVSFNYLPLDQEGMVPDNNYYSLAYVTPYNQFPSGIKMTLKRKNQLLNSNIQYIFEDDFDCDLIFKNQYVSTLFSLNDQKVFFHGSFSHILCPGLRISYLVIPKKLVTIYQEKYQNSSSKISSLDQSIINEFISQGHYYRHLNKIRKINLQKKEIIENYLKNINYISYQARELSFIISLKKEINYKVLKKHLDDALIKIKFINDFTYNLNDCNIIISFSSIKLESITKGLDLLFKIIESLF